MKDNDPPYLREMDRLARATVRRDLVRFAVGLLIVLGALVACILLVR